MKTARVVVALFLFIYLSPYILLSQEAPSGANSIIITTSDKPEIAIKKIGRVLVSSDFEIESADAVLGLITTKLTKKSYGFLGAGSLMMKLTAQIDECDSLTCISITGKFEDDAIENSGMGGSPKKSSWNIMDEVSKEYKGGVVGYKVVNKKQ